MMKKLEMIQRIKQEITLAIKETERIVKENAEAGEDLLRTNIEFIRKADIHTGKAQMLCELIEFDYNEIFLVTYEDYLNDKYRKAQEQAEVEMDNEIDEYGNYRDEIFED